MRLCLLLLTALLLPGCAAMEERQRQMDAAADTAWCAERGITEGHPQHFTCMMLAAQFREQQKAAIASSNMGAYGLMLMNQSQQRPAFGMTSCSYVGNFLNCSHY